MTGTDSVSRYSSVAGTSRIDLTPAQTTSTGVPASTPRSAEMSKLSAAPRCTPPRPPVANTAMPARWASADVDATVVAPLPPSATATPTSRIDSLAMSDDVQSRSSSAGFSPTRTMPSNTAIVAGTAPPARTCPSISSAIRRLSPRGRPWARIVDSSATTAAPVARASATSGAMTRCEVMRLPPGGGWGRFSSGGIMTCTDHQCEIASHDRPEQEKPDDVHRNARQAARRHHYGRRHPEDVPLRPEGEDRRVGRAGQFRGSAVRGDVPGHQVAEAGLTGVPGLQEDLRIHEEGLTC